MAVKLLMEFNRMNQTAAKSVYIDILVMRRDVKWVRHKKTIVINHVTKTIFKVTFDLEFSSIGIDWYHYYVH